MKHSELTPKQLERKRAAGRESVHLWRARHPKPHGFDPVSERLVAELQAGREAAVAETVARVFASVADIDPDDSTCGHGCGRTGNEEATS